MKTSQEGINLIKQFEGCRLQAYKPVAAEPCYTIGYGHYGSDVAPNAVITQAQAEAYLVADLAKYEKAVNNTRLNLNQSQFDALVSFAYNCGAGNLKKLVRNRTLPQIADAMLAYNKGSGKVLQGLVRRRQAERTLFLKGTASGNPYPEPTGNIYLGKKGDDVRWLQYELQQAGYTIKVDGSAGQLTIGTLMDYQKKHDLVPDGICGPLTRATLKLK